MNIYNPLYKDLVQIIQNFDKMNMKEIELTTRYINKNVYEEDLSMIIDELVNLYFKELNEGKGRKIRKNHIFDCINNYKIGLREIYNWLLNNQNNSNSIYLLGFFNYHGIVINVNIRKAFELYQKAAELENNAALFDFANMCIDGEGCKKDYEKAFKLTKKLAEKEYSGGINLLGYCFDNGIGTDVDMQKAFDLYRKAADLGNCLAQYNLAQMYIDGQVVEQDYNKIFELFQKAANLGNCSAQYNLAVMYENGYGTEKDIDKAVYWYKKSANQGDEDAQNELKKLLD
ncbi:kinase-like domain-containing protein [Rhizophagus clarus]|uniref:Kinase-like domain-containing protein n=2 Tax=Rhizophagus clarus TaxID=94130 RepID=A0A8H3QSY7_9GLOM|nr:kinase-like domain-containing protein [Rhizophagus clarus]